MAKQRATKRSSDTLEPDGPVISEAPSPAAVAAIQAGSRRMFTLSPAAAKLLDTAVLVDETDPSKIIDGLILEHLQGYYSGHKMPGPDPTGV